MLGISCQLSVCSLDAYCCFKFSCLNLSLPPWSHGLPRAMAFSTPPNSSEAPQQKKYDYDEIEALILSPPSTTSSTSPNPALNSLELEALALEGSGNFSLREKTQIVNCLLSLLQQKGVPQGYAFEFVRHGRDLIRSLIVEARDGLAAQQDDDDDDVLAASLASRVCTLAELHGLPRFVSYFRQLNLKASDIPIVLAHVHGRMDVVMAKVEFLRSIGVKANQLAAVLAAWPQLLSHDSDRLALVIEYLASLGFSDEEIEALIVKFPQILGQNVDSDLRPTSDALQELGISSKDAKKLMIKNPFLLTENPHKSLMHLISYLESVGVKRKHIGLLLTRRPMLLRCSVEKDLLPIIDFLKTVHATPDDIDKIITSFPWIFRYDIDQHLRPTVKHLENLGVDPFLIGKLFRRYPQLLKNRFNFELKANFLMQLGVDPKDLGRVIYNAPQLLGLSIEENIVPTIEFLTSIGIKGPCLIKVLKQKPMLLAHCIDSKLGTNVKFLENLGVNDENVGKLVTRYPHLLTLSVENNLEPTVTYLEKLGFTRKEIADMVRKLPSLLGFSTYTVIGPKYRYLVDAMKRSPKELLQFPQFFSYSLTKRIIARHQLLGETSQYFSLNSIYGCSDLVFEKRLKKWQEHENRSN